MRRFWENGDVSNFAGESKNRNVPNFFGLLVASTVAIAGQVAWAHEEHEHGQAAPQEQTLTGEVVDVFCYLSHGEQGLGKGHAECARKCIKSGLPVAIKVGDQLYLASMADHTAANQKLVDLAAQQVTVRGKVLERDGQRLIAISYVEKAE